MSAISLAAFTALALQCVPGQSVVTLAAIARTESQLDPLTIYDNTTRQAAHFPDIATARQVTTALIAAGHSVDVGLMQINSKNHAALGLTVDAAFDGCRSLQAAVQVLRWSYAGGVTRDAQQAALVGAISSYNTGNPLGGIANGYVRRVQASAGLLIPDLQLSAGRASGAAPSAHSDVLTPMPPPPPPDDMPVGLVDTVIHKRR